MAIKFINDSILSDIADAIRSKLSVATTYKPSEMATAIGSISGGVTPTGTKQISITQNGTTTEDVTNYANAEITVNVTTNYGTDSTNTLSEMFYALEHNNFSTGTFTVSSYFPANQESEVLDTGFVDNLRGLVIFNTVTPNTVSTSGDIYETVGFFGVASTPGSNQSISSVSGITKTRGGATNAFLDVSCTRRVNNGKLYITPSYASGTNTAFHIGKTYRWIAWGYTD